MYQSMPINQTHDPNAHWHHPIHVTKITPTPQTHVQCANLYWQTQSRLLCATHTITSLIFQPQSHDVNTSTPIHAPPDADAPDTSSIHADIPIYTVQPTPTPSLRANNPDPYPQPNDAAMDRGGLGKWKIGIILWVNKDALPLCNNNKIQMF